MVVTRAMTMESGLRAILCVVAFILFTPGPAAPANEADLESEIGNAEKTLRDASAYRRAASDGDSAQLRGRFLGLEEEDTPAGATEVHAVPGRVLTDTIDVLVDLSRRATRPADRDRVDRLLNQAVQIAVEGWVVSGNVSLLEGLRVSYPRVNPDGTSPQAEPIPYGSLEREFDFIAVRDATRAGLFYAEGVRALLASLRRDPLDGGSAILDIDTRVIPREGVCGHFDSDRFPQYTYYEDPASGACLNEGDTRVVPIRTQAMTMGALLQKQEQAAHTVGRRLWNAAYFGGLPVESTTRGRLLDGAVQELRVTATAQFLSSVALAATVADEGETSGEPPYQFARLNIAASNVDGMRSTIDRIGRNERPLLPIDDVLYGDDQVNGAVVETRRALERTSQAYMAAIAALEADRTVGVEKFREEQDRQGRFFSRLRDLTGVALESEEARESVRTAAGRDAYRESVAERIELLMNADDPSFADARNELDGLVRRVRRLRDQIEIGQRELARYPERIGSLENTLGANVSAIEGETRKVADYLTEIGKESQYSFSGSVGYTTGTAGGWSFSAGVSYDPGAIDRGRLQGRIEQARSVREISFLHNETGARIKELVLERDRKLDELSLVISDLHTATAEVDAVLGETDEILERLRVYDEGADTLWYRDAMWDTELTHAEENASREMELLVERLYRLGRLLEKRWLEPFSNIISVVEGEPVSLGANYENFTNLESVFALPFVNVRNGRSAVGTPIEQATRFLDALELWDRRLRRNRILRFDPLVVEVSLRQDVLPYADIEVVNGVPRELAACPNSGGAGAGPDACDSAAAELRAQNVRRFQNLLRDQIRPGVGNSNLLVKFPLGYFDAGFANYKRGTSRLFGNVNGWNYRIAKFKVKIVPMNGEPVSRERIEIYVAQGGIVSNVSYFARPRRIVGSEDGGLYGEQLVRNDLNKYVAYDREDLGGTTFAPFAFSSVAGHGDYPPEDRNSDTSNMASWYWSPFASEWMLQIYLPNTFEIENIEDVRIEMTLEAGPPDAPNLWRLQ